MQAMKLIEHLKRVGKTPKQFAAEIGVSHQQVLRYLDGTRLPHLTRIPAITAATGGDVTATDFLDAPAEPEPSARPKRRSGSRSRAVQQTAA